MEIDDLCRLAVSRAGATGEPVLVSWNAGAIAQTVGDLRRSHGIGAGRAFYWSSPRTRRQIVGRDVAWESPARSGNRWGDASRSWEALTVLSNRDDRGPLLVGGGAYAAGSASATLPDIAFWVPELQFEAGTAQRMHLTVNVVCHPADSPRSIGARLSAALARGGQPCPLPPETEGPVRRLTERPDRGQWTRQVERVLAGIAAGEAEKVVLARTFEVEVAGGFDIGRVLGELDATDAGAIVFAVTWQDATFLGATPELLVHIEGPVLHSIALAGSAPRGPDANADADFGRRLRRSTKDRHEHALVVDHITRTLAGLGFEVTADEEPQVITHATVQHLGTRIDGKSTADQRPHPFDIIAAMHPTPAVGGTPREAAVRWQRHLEGFDREWYAAPLGWLDRHGNAEIAVGIRSALIRAQHAVVYGGCGIVVGSDPDAEFAESRIKADQMLAALLPGQRPAADVFSR